MSPFLFVLVAQAKKPLLPKPKTVLPVAQMSLPVTALEAQKAFTRVIALYGKVTALPFGSPSIPAANRPVTRDEIVKEMDRLYRTAEPAVRFTPSEIRYDASKIRINPLIKPALVRLVARGFVARVGPLAVGPGPSLTLREFGDALGFFQARLSQVTHLPSPAWTPMLKVD